MDLLRAAANGDFAAVATLLSQGAGIDSRDSNGMTALLLAVDGRRHDVVRFLLKKRANPDVTDKWGQTALMLAAGRNDSVSIRLLLDARADFSIRAGNGLTALGYALDNGMREAAALLKKAGAR